MSEERVCITQADARLRIELTLSSTGNGFIQDFYSTSRSVGTYNRSFFLNQQKLYGEKWSDRDIYDQAMTMIRSPKGETIEITVELYCLIGVGKLDIHCWAYFLRALLSHQLSPKQAIRKWTQQCISSFPTIGLIKRGTTNWERI